MSQTFYEVVLEGNFMLVRGFVIGFLSSINPDGMYFFHRKAGIRRETLKDFLREFFEMDNFVHFCIEGDLIERFKKAVEYYEQETGMKMKSIKQINGASFSFAYEFFNEKLAKETKEIFSKIPEGVTIKNYNPQEKKDEEGKGMEGGYAPLHEFTARGKGIVEGDFGHVIQLYLKIKRSELSETIICSEIDLQF